MIRTFVDVMVRQLLLPYWQEVVFAVLVLVAVRWFNEHYH